ncbi:MAG: hypothetical protein OXU77_20215 [Gammaproteobacteria bacterium]|nr:hypothetical protein [Gammaproteobacteria bacterium]MDE0433145.1 hypothetical protein [Bryobacterales bacterium]
METKKRIYCIEGVHDWGDGKIEPTVEPMLELLQKTGYWDYLHRTCATSAELRYRLEEEWNEVCEKGSVLYFASHGAPDQVWLSDEVAGLVTMKEWADCTGCHVHFGGCDTFSGGEHNLSDFMNSTNATSVSGYAREVGWVDWTAPALTLELQFFAQLSGVNIVNQTRNRARNLRRVEQAVSKRFPDCEFNMLVRPYGQR